MAEEINRQRRRFISAAAMTVAAAPFGLIGSEQVQADETNPATQSPFKPGTIRRRKPRRTLPGPLSKWMVIDRR
jgi:hypothetical protein